MACSGMPHSIFVDSLQVMHNTRFTVWAGLLLSLVGVYAEHASASPPKLMLLAGMAVHELSHSTEQWVFHPGKGATPVSQVRISGCSWMECADAFRQGPISSIVLSCMRIASDKADRTRALWAARQGGGVTAYTRVVWARLALFRLTAKTKRTQCVLVPRGWLTHPGWVR